MKNKFIINFAPTGLIPTKDLTPNVPLSPEEIIEDVCEMVKLGINMVHLHAREEESGHPTYKKEVYAEIIKGIRKHHKDLVICVSTSGRSFPEFEKRSDVLDLKDECKPDFGSLTLSSLNFNNHASMNSPQMIQALAKKMLKNNIRPEFEVFDLGMINYAKYLIRKGFVRPPFYFNLLLGNIACAQAKMIDLGLMIKELPEGSLWSVGGVGNAQLKANLMALLEGGGVRVGIEDNIWYDDARTRLATNRDFVERVLLMADTLGKAPYPQTELRQILDV